MKLPINPKKLYLYRIVLLSFLIFLLLGCLSQERIKDPTFSGLEQVYSNQGPNKIVELETIDPETSERYRIYYPEALDRTTPVILWANGSDAEPDDYDLLLRHLASWGFIVNAPYCRTTGTGKEIARAAEYMKQENNIFKSPFYGLIDIEYIGAVGHSQGSTGVMNAKTNFSTGNIIKTVVSLSLPDPWWCEDKGKYSPEKIDVPYLLLNGSNDYLISSLNNNKNVIAKLAKGTPCTLAIADKAGHLEPGNDGGKHRGILTAWLRFWLKNDNQAAKLFIGKQPEINALSGWSHVILQNMPD